MTSGAYGARDHFEAIIMEELGVEVIPASRKPLTFGGDCSLEPARCQVTRDSLDR